MGAQTPKFSFVVPARNSEKTLASTLASLSAQKHTSFEIIVVDNASTDSTKRLIRTFPNVRYALCPEIGRSQARNFGANIARGNFLAFVDADVELAPSWLFQAETYLEKFSLDAIATQVKPVMDSPSSLSRYRSIFAHWKSFGTFLSVRQRGGAFPLINTAACVVNRRSFERLGGFDETLLRHEDLDFSLRLFSQGFLLGGTSQARARVHFTSGSILPFARELAYLQRSFEVQRHALFRSRIKPINFSLLREIALKSPGTLAYGFLVEAAWQLGGAAGRFRMAGPRVYSPMPGRNLLCTTIHHKDIFYLLRPNLNFLFVNSDIYLSSGPWASKRLNVQDAKILRTMIQGKKISSKDSLRLLRLGAHSPSVRKQPSAPPAMLGDRPLPSRV